MKTTTYNRKYYLIREVKKAGFILREHKNERTIKVVFNKQYEAKRNKYVQELRTKHQYGVQITF